MFKKPEKTKLKAEGTRLTEVPDASNDKDSQVKDGKRLPATPGDGTEKQKAQTKSLASARPASPKKKPSSAAIPQIRIEKPSKALILVTTLTVMTLFTGW